jgi:hypothetical protein
VKAAKPTNMAASVRARLVNMSRASGEDFTYVLTRYSLERLLARLAQSRRTARRSPERGDALPRLVADASSTDEGPRPPRHRRAKTSRGSKPSFESCAWSSCTRTTA